ncbi:MAG: penicillin-binding protein 2 [Armatimonadetes bacterium]|nr:penicillin-binding protein 2 [Armatimonadota bacterium]
MDRDVSARPLRVLGLIILLLVLILAGRLWQVQVVHGDHYLRLSEQNRIRVYPTTAPRGTIVDRRGRALVSNRPSFTVSILPMEVRDARQVYQTLAGLVGLSSEEIAAKVAEGQARPFEPVRIRRDVPLEVVTAIEERRVDLPGVLIYAEPVRLYPEGRLAAHAIGYLGEISEEELRDLRARGYRVGDLIGKAGVERVYDQALRGEDGRLRVEVDAAGRPVQMLGAIPPRQGNSLALSLDLGLQQAAEAALGTQVGAVVAMDPWTGEILAMASWPPYDPNAFAVGISSRTWGRISGDPGRPLVNRAVDAAYEPGSAFKIVTALAALEEGIASRRTSVFCSGTYQLGNWVFKDWKAHGRVNFIEGIAQSCNVMFWTLGRAVGPERLHRYATMLGLGSLTGIDLPVETAGLIPSPQWKQRVRKEVWFPGETLNTAIGQGYVQVTPLQMARALSALVNGGRLLRPRMVRAILTPEGKAVETFRPEATGRLDFSAESLATLREGLVAVVSRGTGNAASVAGLAIGGKTGSAENPRGEPHAWFVGYAPADHPRVVLAVMVEHGRRGGVTAAPIAKRMFEAALGDVVEPAVPQKP